MAVKCKDLWSLVLDHQWVDPHDLADAIEEQVIQAAIDYRTRLLIRDSVNALHHYWGPVRLAEWLDRAEVGQQIKSICKGPWDDDRGFGSLETRVVDATRPETIKQFLRELSVHIRKPVRLEIGGSVALMLPEFLSRRTEDVAIVDEVPAEIRTQHKLIADLKSRYGLEPAHFSAALPALGMEFPIALFRYVRRNANLSSGSVRRFAEQAIQYSKQRSRRPSCRRTPS